MKIEKALSHFEWRLVNKDDKGKVIGLKTNLKPSLNDIEALNSIIKWKELQESITLTRNESLAKLWIHQLILLNNTKLYDGERSIQVIDEILDKDVYEWCMILKEQIPLMRFNSVALDKYPLDDVMNKTKQIERKEAIIKEFETELTKTLKYSISEDNIIKFVKNQINRVISKYEK